MADVPVINDTVEKVDILQEASFGMDGFVSKDISRSELADTLLSKVC